MECDDVYNVMMLQKRKLGRYTFLDDSLTTCHLRRLDVVTE